MAIHHLDGKNSSNLHWARYDEDTNTLSIDFKNSAGEKVSTYEYPDFSIIDWRKLQDAPSPGKHFAAHIRNQYKGRKIWSAKS